jgi:hypothetical protein
LVVPVAAAGLELRLIRSFLRKCGVSVANLTEQGREEYGWKRGYRLTKGFCNRLTAGQWNELSRVIYRDCRDQEQKLLLNAKVRLSNSHQNQSVG